MIDRGSGPPLVLIPGIQGRWEWMTPTIRTLADRHRVLSFSLYEGPSSPDTNLFDGAVDHIDAMLDRAGLERATVVGISFGGLLAVRYAARRPSRVDALVLVSVPSPRPHLDGTSSAYVRNPRLALPRFVVRAARRLVPEVFALHRRWSARIQFLAEHSARVLRFPVSPTRMAAWVNAWRATDIESDCARVAAPTLVMTGEAHLDRVVPVNQTKQYLSLIPGATYVQFRGTGHVGLVSQPKEFAALVDAFLFLNGSCKTEECTSPFQAPEVFSKG
jgi:3-oxoadipate enol-lactonase